MITNLLVIRIQIKIRKKAISHQIQAKRLKDSGKNNSKEIMKKKKIIIKKTESEEIISIDKMKSTIKTLILIHYCNIYDPKPN